jgi:molybdopterin molybdotransferase
MISVEEATSLVHSEHWIPSIEHISIFQSLGRVLAEEVFADRPFPPFDRVMMDGIAIRKSDFDNGVREFEISGLLPAGSAAIELPRGNSCLEIMTGAVMANNADVVIRYEDIEIANGTAKVLIDEVSHFQNIHPQESDRKRGSLLIPANAVIGPAEIGVLATVGSSQVPVLSLPRVLIVSTGDELVDVGETPHPHQIRKSNVHMLEALCDGHDLASKRIHLTDNLEEIVHSLRLEFEHTDVVLLSGGVSKGKLDFLPEALETLGIEKLFHRVAQRPGKPFWYGRNQNLTVFAFPGNPASTFMCAKRYFEPWLKTSMRLKSTGGFAVLTEDFAFKPSLQYFLQCRTETKTDGVCYATPVPGQGSGDLANLVDADSFMELPAERANFEAGEAFPVWKF